jgi:proline iminopeptidase
VSLLLLNGCAKQDDIERSSGVVSVEGAELHYVIEGEGIPCLVLGHLESGRRILSQELRNHFRFVFLDLRHDAQSNNSLEMSQITLGTYLDDIDEVRRTLGLDKTVVLGHSHHGLIALEYARKYPQHTSHVVMTGCMPYTDWRAGDEFWESDASDERKMLLEQNWEGVTEDQLSEMSQTERYMRNRPGLLYDPTYDLSYIIEVVDNNYDVFIHYLLGVLEDYDIANRPGRVETPVFLVIGRYDYVSPYYLWDDRKGVLPNLSYNLFEKSGHFPMVEEQELFDDRLIEWISNQ